MQLTDPPQYPVPQPPRPQVPQIHAPMVYVYEKQRWEYRLIIQSSMSEEELNALGAEGWELAGVVASPEKTQFYFKRART